MAFTNEIFKGAVFQSLDGITVSANCKLRKIFTLKYKPQDTADKDGMFKLLSRFFSSPVFKKDRCLLRMQGAQSFLGRGLLPWGRGRSRLLQALPAFRASLLLTRPVPPFVFLKDPRILMFHFFRKVTPITQGRDFVTFSLVPAHKRPSILQERMSEKASLDTFGSWAM